ncbi:glycosyltransferase family 2 protein [Lysinibacillus parviboronicapiens]|uniref:glycosyltransferase family 2 protein n=1 Tax=Lysinibacillus parviboronicapiens TaxID=436516 RepID=UPI001EE6F748|nr:glycosyltransferase [Lysinibacillus parviboronicapiens]
MGDEAVPFLSIIVPIYNVEPYLRKCIESILKQQFVDFELILVNDGSTDSCPIICEEYAERDARIIVIHQENGGLVSARKAGLTIACGQYIGYVDSDDWIEADMYSALCDAARKFDVDIVICDIVENYSEQEVKRTQFVAPGLYRKDRMKQEVYPVMLYSGEYFRFGLFPSVSNKLFKRELLEKFQFEVDERIRLGEDVACTYPCLLEANRIFILQDKYLYHYRQTPSSMTAHYDDKFFEKILVLCEQLNDCKRKTEDVVPNFTEQLQYYFTYLAIAAVQNEFSRYNHKRFHKKKSFIKKILAHEDIHKALHAVQLKEMPLKSKVYIRLLKKQQIQLLYVLVLVNRFSSDMRDFNPVVTKG